MTVRLVLSDRMAREIESALQYLSEGESPAWDSSPDGELWIAECTKVAQSIHDQLRPIAGGGGQ